MSKELESALAKLRERVEKDWFCEIKADEAAALLAKIEAADRLEWQPIETAPKDGTVLLLYRYRLGSFSWAICYWNRSWDAWSVYENPDKHFSGATHWMPLHEAPATYCAPQPAGGAE